MLFYEILGNIGMVLITISLFPQVYKTCTEKNTEGISLLFCLSQLVAGSCMIPYGFYLNSLPIIIINIGMTVNQIALLIMIIKYGKVKENNINL